jgi:tetratricopeptide (TPR) repeat protein
MIPDKETRDIQAYLRGTLPKIRREKFELKLQNDPEFEAKVNELRPIFETLEDISTETKIKEIIINQNEIEPLEENQKEMSPKKIKPLFQRVFQYSAAACVLLLLGVVWYDSTSSSRLYGEYYKPESVGRSGNFNDCPDKISLSLYYQKAFQSFLESIEKMPSTPCNAYYKGLCYLEFNNQSKAIALFKQATLSNDNYIKQSSEWYLGLALIKNNEEGKAKDVFQQILKTPEHQYEMNAKELVVKLDKEPFLFRIRF